MEVAIVCCHHNHVNDMSVFQDTRSELKTCSEELQHLSEENSSLIRQLSETRQQVSALETLNFSLEEQLMETAGGGAEGGEGEGNGERKRKRGYTLSLLENGLAEKDKVLVLCVECTCVVSFHQVWTVRKCACK